MFSFGSQVRTAQMPAEAKRGILAAFAHFVNHTFVWKVDADDELFNNGDDGVYRIPANMHMFEWLPQVDLLRMYAL